MPRGRAGKKAEAVVVQSAELIGWAVGGIEREIQQTRQRLAALMAQAEHLRRRAASGRARGPLAAPTLDAAAAVVPRRRRRRMSAEARKRVSERMTKRWAEWRKKHAK